MLTRFFVDLKKYAETPYQKPQAKTPPLHYGLRLLDYKQEKQNGYGSLRYSIE